jgi:hypothetical protein
LQKINQMDNQQLTPEASLALIQSMLERTRNNISNNGFYYIFWGWLVFAAAMIHYISLKLGYEQGGIVWLLMPVGAVVTVIYGRRQNKARPVKTHMEHFFSYLWIAFGIALFITLMMSGMHGIKATYFFLMILYGLATFTAGGALSFAPLMIGGILSFICAICSVFLGDQEQLLCLAVAVLVAYIIPGHLFAAKYKSH